MKAAGCRLEVFEMRNSRVSPPIRTTQVQSRLGATPAGKQRPRGAAPRHSRQQVQQAAAPPPARSYPSIDPRSPLGRCIALYLDVEYQPALPLLTEATRVDPGDPRGFAYLAAAYYKLGLTRKFEAAGWHGCGCGHRVAQTCPLERA
ncbi:hypothetical protein [Phenylobacterium sp.]|uniref:hypothetical protein n=1 Tax=Phenylobacterium sp. TaxID=1871053 RepID=UPI002ED88037